MGIVYAPQSYILKDIGNLIADKSADDKVLIKAQELAKIILPDKFSLNGYDIEIVEQPSVENGCLKVIVKAFKDGKELFVDNPLLFKNPPIMIPDGTWYKVIDPITGSSIDKHNLVEDPLQSLQSIITDTIRITGKVLK